MRTFGIEIESVSREYGNREEVANALIAHLNVTFPEGRAHLEWVHETHPYDKDYPAINFYGKNWVLKSDGSVIGGLDVEVVSPILAGDTGIKEMQTITRAMRAIGMKINNSCGVHVHVGISDLKTAHFRRLVSRWASVESLALSVLRHAGGGSWAKPFSGEIENNVRNGKLAKFSMLQLAAAVNDDTPTDTNGRAAVREFTHTHYTRARYRGLNLVAIWQKGTVEFRTFQFSGKTPHAGQAKAFIQFSVAMVENAKKTERWARPRFGFSLQDLESGRIMESDLKGIWRRFLVHLGLTGDDFKTLRTHLISRQDWNRIWQKTMQRQAYIEGGLR